MLVYADASALVKLVLDEPESPALRAYLSDASVVSSELVLVESPRAIRRAARDDPALPLGELLSRAAELMEALGLAPLGRDLLVTAGALPEPGLRALDAVHIAAALTLAPIDAFVSYDRRQGAAARLAELRTLAPGS